MPYPSFRAYALALFLGAASVSVCLADDAPAAPAAQMTATIGTCVAQALAKNFSVQIQQFSLDSAKAGVVIAQSAYDPSFGVTWQRVVNQSPTVTTSINTAAGGAKPTTDNQSTNATITQPVITGGTITATYALSRDQSNIVQSLLNPAYDGQSSISVSQPLLQGAGTDYGRAEIQIAQLGGRIAGFNFKSQVLTVVYNVESSYYNVVFTQQQYAVGQDTLKLAQQLLDENTVKRQTGVLTDLDVAQAEAGVATARSQLIGFKQAMDNAADTLLEAMGETEFKTPVGTLSFPPLSDTNVSVDLSYKLARDNGPNLAIVQATIEQFKLDALRAKRNALPQLNANGGLGYLSAQHSYGDANSGLWPGAGYNWNAGLSLSFPWGLRNSRALYRQAMDNVRSEQATYDQADQALLVNVRAAVRAVEANVEGVAAAQETVRADQKQYELEKAKFDAGLDTSYDVLQAQDQLETARVSELQSEVSLRVALAELHMLEGSSLDSYRINLRG